MLYHFCSSSYIGDQAMEDEMGGACSTHASEDKFVLDFSGKLKEKHVTYTGVDGRKILKLMVTNEIW
jgi:hypothetical protein